MFAVVDIETTGGNPNRNKIIEIACIILDENGNTLKEYQTLINPLINIPTFITSLTNISNDMVEGEPSFEDLSFEIFQLLKGQIFVAHNVNFDFTFLKAEFARCGFNFDEKKLCTVRLGRKIFPGLKSYSLGNFAHSKNIVNDAPHRAMGDCAATAKLFKLMLEADSDFYIKQSLKRNASIFALPSNLDLNQVKQLPKKPGVYYFKNQVGKIIYIGKAKSIFDRVKSHFSGYNPESKRQGFLKEIFTIDYKETGSELIAMLMEDAEIKKYWPKYNKAQKHNTKKYGVYIYQNQNKSYRIVCQQVSSKNQPDFSFISQSMALKFQSFIKSQLENFEFDKAKIKHAFENEFQFKQEEEGEEIINAGTFVIKTKGKDEFENGFVLIEKGIYRGFGFVPTDENIFTIDELENYLNFQKQSIECVQIINLVLRKMSINNFEYQLVKMNI